MHERFVSDSVASNPDTDVMEGVLQILFCPLKLLHLVNFLVDDTNDVLDSPKLWLIRGARNRDETMLIAGRPHLYCCLHIWGEVG